MEQPNCRFIDRAKNRPLYEVTLEDVSVPDMMAFLRRVLQGCEKKEMLPVRELFERQKSRKAMICLFLAILEMVKVQAVAVVQSDLFGEIAIRRHKGFDDFVSSEETAKAVEEEYN